MVLLLPFLLPSSNPEVNEWKNGFKLPRFPLSLMQGAASLQHTAYQLTQCPAWKLLHTLGETLRNSYHQNAAIHNCSINPGLWAGPRHLSQSLGCSQQEAMSVHVAAPGSGACCRPWLHVRLGERGRKGARAAVHPAVHATTTTTEPGHGAAVCSLPATCCEQPSLHSQWQLPRARGSCGTPSTMSLWAMPWYTCWGLLTLL